MVCFHLETFSPSTRRLVEAATCWPSLARLAERLSLILQIINHNVFNADSLLVNWTRLRVALRSSLLNDSIEFVV